jgi:hypothetical protein
MNDTQRSTTMKREHNLESIASIFGLSLEDAQFVLNLAVRNEEDNAMSDEELFGNSPHIILCPAD